MTMQPYGVEQLRGKCALVDGAFDPLHHGHIAYVEAARKWLDRQRQNVPLVCNVAPDDYLGSKHVPFLSYAYRVGVMSGVKYAQYVMSRPTVEAIKLLQPTHYIKGKNWEGRLPAELYTLCREMGVSIKHVETGFDDVSSTALLRTWQHETMRRGVAGLGDFVCKQPAPKPWRPVVDYSLEARRIAEGPRPELIRDTFSPRTVLDYGAGHGHLVTMLREIGVDAYGFEPYLILKTPHPYVGNVRKMADLVVCLEVLEHVPLVEWPECVENMVLCANRFIYLTTRFHPNPSHPLDVTADGHREIDPTEITFTTKELLHLLFALHGCTRSYGLEERMDWKRDGNTLVFER